jgi:hypothetical protein
MALQPKRAPGLGVSSIDGAIRVCCNRVFDKMRAILCYIVSSWQSFHERSELYKT